MADVHKASPFRWSKNSTQAAIDLAEDELSDEAIAAKAGVTRRTLANWKLHPEFQQRISDELTALQNAMRREPIAKRRYRLRKLGELEQRAWTVVTERADDPDIAHVPGGKSGMVVRQIKIVGTGKMAREVEEYAYDTGLSRDLQAIYEQGAKEVGDWQERIDLSGSLTNTVQLIGVSAEDV